MKTFWSITALASLGALILLLGNLSTISAGQDASGQLVILVVGIGGPLAIAIFSGRKAMGTGDASATPIPSAVASPAEPDQSPTQPPPKIAVSPNNFFAPAKPLQQLGHIELINEIAQLEKLVRQQTRKVENIRSNVRSGAIGVLVGALMTSSFAPWSLLLGLLLIAAGSLAFIINSLGVGNEAQMLYITEDALTDCRARLAIVEANMKTESQKAAKG